MRRLVLLRRITAAALIAGSVLGAQLAESAVRHAGRHQSFRPRIGTGMGIIPRLGLPELASGQNIPVVYHGGRVMRDVTLHTVFWAPAGYRFDPSPATGVPGYEALVKQFLGDVAHDSAHPANVFSTLTQYHDAGGPGSTRLAYDPAVDSIDVSDPYPSPSRQCASPAGVATCVTDLQLQHELDRVISEHGGARGLHELWLILLPPNVDTCLQSGSCATNAYAGYHSTFDLGHGSTVYVSVPDPLVELTPAPGSDPQGNPEAETTLDTIAHEIEEAITNPIGEAWMDPNGFETGDKCESGPQEGTPLGYAPDGSPYNQLINGHEYLIQEMWSNAASGCVSSSSATGSALPLHTVSLHQFSPWVSGSLGKPGRVSVDLLLVRGLSFVAEARTRTRADGSWGPVKLRDGSGAPHAVGDDREGLIVNYGGGQPPELIATGDGGNPFSQAGFTGWFDLDHFVSVDHRNVLIAPCSQVGVLSLRVGPRRTAPPAELCSAEADLAVVPTPPIGPGTRVSLSSQDNRSVSVLEPAGALVRMTVRTGEPGSLPDPSLQVGAIATGFPTCTAFLRIGSVSCAGLVPGSRYALARRHARADGGGRLSISGLRLHGGQVLSLTNRAGRRLTALHVAHLRVDITGNQTVIASGRCQPDEFYGPAPRSAPTAQLVGTGMSGLGTICPPSGQARGLPVADIAQTDEFSGGQTMTRVPLIESTAPIQDETLYGSFVASAQSGLPAPHGATVATGTPIALTITPAGSRRPIFRARNVDTARGVRVAGLAPGAYMARWVLRDLNGDTRTLITRFADQ